MLSIGSRSGLREENAPASTIFDLVTGRHARRNAYPELG